ncbi:MAG TPA: transketolase [Niallia sp.]|nr:transketolase [Niallia sp.]
MSNQVKTNIEQLAINTIRTLSIDAIEKSNSGHPGMPMGAAPMAYTLWAKEMNHNPSNPNWFNRDRFVLSAGHGSMLLYSLLHLFKYDVTIDDLKNFRQWGSKTPGHPEFGHTPGVEATTGPLGQGIAMAVGMAMAERHLAETYNKENYPVVDHYTYSICGDGDLMEGVSAEAASLAGHLKLGRLVVLYDSNDISLDGDLNFSFSESVQKRFEAYGWEVIRVEDGNDTASLQAAIAQAKKSDVPTLIEVKTVIGYGSPNKGGKSASHGAPLGASETLLAKQTYAWEYEEAFHVPAEVSEHYASIAAEGAEKEKAWNELYEGYKASYPELAAQLETAIKGEVPSDLQESLPEFTAGESMATRDSSGKTIQAAAKAIPSLFGGSADLAGSNKTLMTSEKNFALDGGYAGRNIWFGVREFAMGAALNGLALHGGVKVFGATFFVFSDYLRPAIRLAALMKLPVTYVFTHDSIAVGEDGPTHEPVEQLASLRAMPGLSIIRPADAKETAAAWQIALESQDTPTALVLTRQGLPTLDLTKAEAYEGVKNGAYTVSPAKDAAEALILATGSEVSLAIQAQAALAEEGISVSVVSMPSWDLFEKQSAEYKESVLPESIQARVAIEAGASLGWREYVGSKGELITIDHFGASAPANKLFEEYGFTVENVVAKVKASIQKTK